MTENCGAENRDGDPCALSAGWGTDHVGEGRCKFHGGAASGGAREGSGAPENNGNAETHGLTSDAETWFERHRDDVEDDVREMVDDWMQLAPFGWEITGHVRLLTNAAINECQIEHGDRYIKERGEIVQEMVPVGEGAIQKDGENPAFLYKSRLQKDTLRILNKLGILDSPEQQQADATQSLVDILSE